MAVKDSMRVHAVFRRAVPVEVQQIRMYLDTRRVTRVQTVFGKSEDQKGPEISLEILEHDEEGNRR